MVPRLKTGSVPGNSRGTTERIVAIVEHCIAVRGPDAGYFGSQRSVIGIEIGRTALSDFITMQFLAGKIERFAIKSRGGHQLGGCLSWIKRGARWIAVEADDVTGIIGGEDSRV